MQQKTTLQENLEYQKITAQKFKSNWPATEIVRFTQEGSVSGSGQWAANAIVTIGGKEYREIIGPWETGGEPLPDPRGSVSSGPVMVIYSNGTSGVLE